ncbi:MAG: DUF494 domain-containing protein [Burkholderiales bacterium]
MFEVLVYVYENYYAGESCPESEHLERKLNAVGFESDQIDETLSWLDALHTAARGTSGFTGPLQPLAHEPWLREPSPTSMRIYVAAERRHLGTQCIGFISFLENAGVLPASMREVVIDRAMAAAGAPVALDDLKIIILMVYWSFGREPDALVLDELCEDVAHRVVH